MSEKHLLLPSAKSAVLVHERSRAHHYVRNTVVIIGVLCVLVGGADVASRFTNNLGPDAAFNAFAPAAALNNPAFKPAATSTTAITPARLQIPSLGINAAIESVGTKTDGTMGTPKDFDDVAWYSPGAKPGQAGSSVFAGHVNNGLLRAGVFEQLSQIKQGDYITVLDTTGRALVYRVSSVTEYPANASSDAIFATSGPSQIALITCDGDWVPSKKTFDKRLVVIAKPAY